MCVGQKFQQKEKNVYGIGWATIVDMVQSALIFLSEKLLKKKTIRYAGILLD